MVYPISQQFNHSTMFTALLEKFGAYGEKTSWTHIVIPPDVAEALMPGRRTSFRVKGLLDSHAIAQVALIPMGQADGWDGQFILVVNAGMRRAIGKEAGATVCVELAVDYSPLPESADLLACLADDPAAEAAFQALPPGHRRYYHNWVESAKTASTKAKRITMTVTGLSLGLTYGEMIRHFKNKNQ
jgi:Domain of unknown function (DUF1905)/Bacteriocin-protection, YdeI or OmpD-Associated